MLPRFTADVSLNVFSKVCMRHIYKLTFIYLQDDIDILVSLYIFFFQFIYASLNVSSKASRLWIHYMSVDQFLSYTLATR